MSVSIGDTSKKNDAKTFDESRIERMIQRWSGVRGPPRPNNRRDKSEIVTSREEGEELTNRESIIKEDCVIGEYYLNQMSAMEIKRATRQESLKLCWRHY